jgi:hypothetical protein
MAGDELDELYGARPEEFTALRTRLVGAAKKRGDADAAKQIAAARKPTTAAWAVNRLVHTNGDAKRSLTDLGERLRAAHGAMDGAAIRELSAEQRSLVDHLARAALEGAEVGNPSAALREDVVATLQAAIADPDVADRLGRLAKAEQWSGFGDFGATAVVTTAARGGRGDAEPKRKARPAPQPDTSRERGADERASARKVEEAKAAVAAAERAKGDADTEMSDRQTDLAVARLRRDEMQRRLDEAERALAAADEAYRAAKQAGRDAAELVKEAKAALRASQRAT